MTYLELVNDFMIESNIDDQVTTVVGQQDDSLKAVTWVRDAWTQIQRSERWAFMAEEGTFDTVADQAVYTYVDLGIPTSSGEVDYSSFRIPSNKTFIRTIDNYDSIRFRDETGTYPVRLGRDFNGSVKLDPIPTGVITITFDKWAEPVVLTNNTDTPTLPPAWHKAIVWLALKNYAREQGAEWNGLYIAATREYNHMNSDMMRKYLPVMQRKVPLSY